MAPRRERHGMPDHHITTRQPDLANRSAMPSLEGSFPTLVGLESDGADSVRESRTRAETFESLLRVAIARASENARSDLALQALDRAGLLEPQALAAAELTEV